MTNTNKLPITFLVIGIVALIWNILGLLNFFSQTMISAETLAALPLEQQELLTSTPLWLKVVFGVATLSGVIASVGLLMKKAWSVPLFFLSLIAVLIQMTYSTFATNAVEVQGSFAYVLATIVMLYALFLWYYAKKALSKGWLN